MRCLVINLPLAWERREAIEHEFRKIGLDFELRPAISGFDLTNDIKDSVDHATRDRLGMRRLDDFSVACLLSHMAILRELVNGADDMVAIFEDDARLHPDLPDVLDALEGKANKFDVVKLQRLTSPRYYPVYELLSSHSLGRVKYHDRGAYGYVITRYAAAQLLDRFPHPVHEIDMIMPRFWENGLRNVLYVNPPVVFHDDATPSYIEAVRLPERIAHKRAMLRSPALLCRRLVAAVRRAVHRRIVFRQLRRQDRDIDPFSF